MTTVLEIQNKLKEFNAVARTSSDSSLLQTTWQRLFSQRLGPEAARSFADFYREMRKSNTVKHSTKGGKKASRRLTSAKTIVQKKHRKTGRRLQRGGAAPLGYTMTPGLPVKTFGEFPIEAATDSQSIKDLDVFWQSGHGPSAPPAYWPTVPADMGSNKVPQAGGGRRNTRRAQRGGSLMETITMRSPFSYISTVPQNTLQTAAGAWSGTPAAVSSNPVDPAWTLKSDSAGGPLNPAVVAPVNNPSGGLATSSLWGSTM